MGERNFIDHFELHSRNNEARRAGYCLSLAPLIIKPSVSGRAYLEGGRAIGIPIHHIRGGVGWGGTERVGHFEPRGRGEKREGQRKKPISPFLCSPPPLPPDECGEGHCPPLDPNSWRKDKKMNFVCIVSLCMLFSVLCLVFVSLRPWARQGPNVVLAGRFLILFLL